MNYVWWALVCLNSDLIYPTLYTLHTPHESNGASELVWEADTGGSGLYVDWFGLSDWRLQTREGAGPDRRADLS